MTSGLLVMAYGSPTSADDIEAYYTHIRRGRPPTDAQLADLTRRYEAVGGTTALAARTAEQVTAIESALAGMPDETDDWVVALGTKHSTPGIGEGMASLVESDVGRIVGLVLSPHYCAASVGEYHGQAASMIEEVEAVEYRRIDNWHMLDALIAFQADQVRHHMRALPERTMAVFTAHSLPERVLTGDPYPDQLRESASAIAALAGLESTADWCLGWQSAGATPEAWRGPDLLESIAELGHTGRYDGVLVVPQGFTSAHLEVLHDIDIEASAAAEEAGLAFRRTQVVNDDPAVMDALASLVKATADRAESDVGNRDRELA